VTDALNLSSRKFARLGFLKLGVPLVVLTCSIFGCSLNKRVSLSDASLSDERLAVYGALLDALSSAGFKHLADRTIVFDPAEISASSPCLQGLQLENLVNSGRSIHLLNPEIVKGRKLELVNSRLQAALTEEADKATIQAGNLKERAQTRSLEYGFLVLSEVAFDKAHELALIKYNFVCGAHCLTSQTYLMAKVGGQWKLKGRPCTMIVN
jgi:hypothetical protein